MSVCNLPWRHLKGKMEIYRTRSINNSKWKWIFNSKSVKIDWVVHRRKENGRHYSSLGPRGLREGKYLQGSPIVQSQIRPDGSLEGGNSIKQKPGMSRPGTSCCRRLKEGSLACSSRVTMLAASPAAAVWRVVVGKIHGFNYTGKETLVGKTCIIKPCPVSSSGPSAVSGKVGADLASDIRPWGSNGCQRCAAIQPIDGVISQWCHLVPGSNPADWQPTQVGLNNEYCSYIMVRKRRWGGGLKSRFTGVDAAWAS